MIKVGDSILLDGKRAKVLSRIAAGKHARWTLSDGRTIVDLDKRDGVEVVAPQLERLPIKSKKNKWERSEPQGGGLIDPTGIANGEDLHD